jgi:hypothetical protein
MCLAVLTAAHVTQHPYSGVGTLYTNVRCINCSQWQEPLLQAFVRVNGY